jgi:hypothetical protein
LVVKEKLGLVISTDSALARGSSPCSDEPHGVNVEQEGSGATIRCGLVISLLSRFGLHGPHDKYSAGTVTFPFLFGII